MPSRRTGWLACRTKASRSGRHGRRDGIWRPLGGGMRGVLSELRGRRTCCSSIPATSVTVRGLDCGQPSRVVAAAMTTRPAGTLAWRVQYAWTSPTTLGPGVVPRRTKRGGARWADGTPARDIVSPTRAARRWGPGIALRFQRRWKTCGLGSWERRLVLPVRISDSGSQTRIEYLY